MNQQEMTNIVREELRHIPPGDGRMHGWLRAYYNGRRMHDLAKGNTTKEKTLTYCINEIRKEDSNWHPEYDPTFFKI